MNMSKQANRRQEDMRKSFVKNIQKVNNTFYGTLRANIMPKPSYNFLIDAGKTVSNGEQRHTTHAHMYTH
jgi:hypothetical protein